MRWSNEWLKPILRTVLIILYLAGSGRTLVALIWLNVANLSILHLSSNLDYQPCTPFVLPALLPASGTDAQTALANARAMRPDLSRIDRSEGLLWMSQGALADAARSLEQYLVGSPHDVGARQWLANLYSALDRPAEAWLIYRENEPAIASESTGVMGAALARQLVIEQARAGHLALLAGDTATAEQWVSATLAREPANVVALYDQMQLDGAAGKNSGSARQRLKTYGFELPEDPQLGRLLPLIASDLVKGGVWSTGLAQGIQEYVMWQADWRGLTPSPVCAYTPPHLWPTSLANRPTEGNLVFNPTLQVERGSARPWGWQWGFDQDGKYQPAVAYGGVEYQSDLKQNALRVTGLGMADEPGRSPAHGGFSQWITVHSDKSYRLRFSYRTNDDTVTAVNLYLLWDDQKGDSQGIAVNLVGTDGQWQQFDQVLRSPIDSPTQLYIGLRRVGSGTVWFADLSLEAGE